MKPKLKTKIVRVEYWDCGNPDHRHKNKDVALACIEKREARTTLSTGARKWTNEAYSAVLAEHRAGSRQCDLAKSLGLSPESVRKILAKAEQLERAVASNEPLDTLSVRARNCLLSQNLRTVESVRAALAAGMLDDVPNFGDVSKSEVRRWLYGLPPNAEIRGGEAVPLD
jgi:DNA-directed RNA polymerase alpha subunit